MTAAFHVPITRCAKQRAKEWNAHALNERYETRSDRNCDGRVSTAAAGNLARRAQQEVSVPDPVGKHRL
ncbi:hypothetical protein MKUB_31150 [Mycobacterium kubicae]|uniref:Uncharacterized protein n=1 Tax=Mycobacterium kubicae TaxID=120959 RepID=A0ABQ1BPI6_9MYCO|nr:hypothetical protein MKUB_31150 [Mycobacterium kubicae]